MRVVPVQKAEREVSTRLVLPAVSANPLALRDGDEGHGLQSLHERAGYLAGQRDREVLDLVLLEELAKAVDGAALAVRCSIAP